jgi:hypothetical protein
MNRYILWIAVTLTCFLQWGCTDSRKTEPLQSTHPAAEPAIQQNSSPEIDQEAPPAKNTRTDWTTPFERSKGLETPRYDETVAYCRDLAEASPLVQFTQFGQSPQGRPLPLLIVDKNGNFTPDKVRASNNAVLLVEACIHAGESNGKDAGLMLLRDMTVAGELTSLLDHVTVLFIPIFNVDGHERFGPYNRINQNGPREMGWRTNAQNINLNRDFLKADTQEMRAWLSLFNQWLPDFFVDIHSTDGADYQYPVTYMLETFGNMDTQLTAWTRDYLNRVEQGMSRAGVLMAPYFSFKNWHDPKSGMELGPSGPRYSQGYLAIQNRPGLLIETHMLKDYQTRVNASYEMLKQTLTVLNQDHQKLTALVQEADRRVASQSFRKKPFGLKFKTSETAGTFDFKGFEYDIVKSDLTGGDWVKFSENKSTFQIPLYNDVTPSVTVNLPQAYIIPPQWTAVLQRLATHGLSLSKLTDDTEIVVRSYRFENVTPKADKPWHTLPYEGRYPNHFETITIVEKRTFPAGSVVVDLNQRAARVAAHLLEPEGPDSFVYWGFFNTIFQYTEYVESYVIEKMARQMLAKDSALKKAFETAKAASPELKRNPRAVRDWFYRRLPHYDAAHNVYPVGLIDDRDVLGKLPTAPIPPTS